MPFLGGVTGLLQSVALLQKRELGDDTVYVYELSYLKGPMRLRLAVAPDGKLAAFGLSPAERR